MTAGDLRDRLRTALPAAMRARDTGLVALLRATLAALENAEAVPAPADDPGSLALEATPAGVGAREVPRRELSADDVAGVVAAEIAGRRDAAAVYARAGRPAEAERLRREADALAALAGPEGP